MLPRALSAPPNVVIDPKPLAIVEIVLNDDVIVVNPELIKPLAEPRVAEAALTAAAVLCVVCAAEAFTIGPFSRMTAP